MSRTSRNILLSLAALILMLVIVMAVSGRSAPAELPEAVNAEPEPATEEILPAYAEKLFDTSFVHTLDITMPAENWQTFLDTCTDKAYWACDLTIDGEFFGNAAIRAKGNSSMSMVGNGNKYSFKIEFDHYADTLYYGLDKLNLNNMILDDSCMRDYLVYRVMDEFGVDAPLCSFIFVTVNGEDFGLYLAVEGVEEAFLERNYGAEYGELYKPDNISNHKGDSDTGMFDAPGDMPDMPQSPEWSSDEPDESTSGEASDEPSASDEQTASDEVDASDEPETNASGEASDDAPSFEMPSFEMPTPGGDGGGFSMGAEDVKLQYIDDDPDSYPNIFASAKTDVSRRDKYRLIAALKNLSERTELASTLDMDEVMRYFVAHLFSCNNDSYTGSMVHNYYLYEENGQLSMIPWDYNLAFGEQNGAEQAVNDPIDTPTSSSIDSLPMIAWIFSDETYLAQYHALYAEFLETFVTGGRIDALIEEGRTMLSGYVARDPNSFCTEQEFQTGADQLKLFCHLRAQSIAGQLDGTIPSTTEGQKADSSALIDASALSASGEPSGNPS